jgi:hypothetical protein
MQRLDVSVIEGTPQIASLIHVIQQGLTLRETG